MYIHIVRPGDTLYAIGRTHEVPLAKLIQDNQLEYPDRLVIGQAIVVDKGTSGTYTVRPGDTLYAIAASFGLSVPALMAINPEIENANLIRPGQIIRLPGVPSPLKRTIVVKGYAYPHIQAETFARTLPYLTYLTLFSYNVNANGTLVPLQEGTLIERARAQNVESLMAITNFDASGSFSADRASAILNNTRAQDTLIQAIISTLREKGYTGVNVDFEYVSGQDREAYNRFLERLVQALRPLGYSVTTAVPPKTSSTQRGALYEGVDYAAHGRIVDAVLLMTYDWGWKYGSPMAVSPLNRMEEVVQYAVTQIPPEKILLGIPNYGYDWQLPYQSGQGAQLIMNNAATSLAVTHWSPIQFDTLAQTPFFHYWDARGREHVVWFDDARSYQAKLGLVEKYNLGGIGYWNINTLFLPGWLVLASMYNVQKATT